MADEEKKASSGLGKIVATVFGAVIAPILVAVGVKWIPTPGGPTSPQPLVAQAPTTPQPQPPPPTPAGHPRHTGRVPVGPHKPPMPDPAPPPPPSTDDVVNLVSAPLGAHLYSYGWSDEKNAYVKKPPVDPVLFRYAANPPSIAAGGPVQGVLLTKKEYENYTLTVEFRWAEKVWPPREAKARSAAILLHATGPDGGFKDAWPQCIAVLLTEGNIGSLQLCGSPGAIKCVARVKEGPAKRKRDYVGGEIFGLPLVTGEPPMWNGIIHRLGFPEKGSDVLGWHPPGDPAKPGETNKVVLDCDGDKIRVVVNGKPVNEITGLNVKKGRIGFTADHADYTISTAELEHFRR